MKNIFSLMLASTILVSSMPVVYALDEPAPKYYCDVCKQREEDCICDANETNIPEVGTTTVTLVGTEEIKGSYYDVTVPAQISPGDNTNISVTGSWKSTETLKITAPEKVTLYYGNQSIDVGVDFGGISQIGNDFEDCTATANLTIQNASVKFGTWIGILEYNVTLEETGEVHGVYYNMRYTWESGTTHSYKDIVFTENDTILIWPYDPYYTSSGAFVWDIVESDWEGNKLTVNTWEYGDSIYQFELSQDGKTLTVTTENENAIETYIETYIFKLSEKAGPSEYIIINDEADSHKKLFETENFATWQDICDAYSEFGVSSYVSYLAIPVNNANGRRVLPTDPIVSGSTYDARF